jgi:hypothetical protein
MANLFTTAANFTDGTNTPPACWDGTSYVVVNDETTLAYTGSVATGDTIAFTGSSVAGITTANVSYFNGSTTVSLLNVTLSETPTAYSATLPTGGSSYEVTVNPGSGCASDTATLTPTANPPAPPAPSTPDCGELGRVTRSFVSGYTAARNESRRIRRFSKRCCVADFNGAMPLGVTIVAVRWDCTSPWSINISNARIESTNRTVACDAAFNYAGWGALQATATWSNGEITSQQFQFEVLDRPIFPNAIYGSSNGPYTIQYP